MRATKRFYAMGQRYHDLGYTWYETMHLLQVRYLPAWVWSAVDSGWSDGSWRTL